MAIVDDPHGGTGLIDSVDLLDEVMEHVHGDVLRKIGHNPTNLVRIGRLAREGRQSALNGDVLVDITENTVQEDLAAAVAPLVVFGDVLQSAFEDLGNLLACLAMLPLPRCVGRANGGKRLEFGLEEDEALGPDGETVRLDRLRSRYNHAEREAILVLDLRHLGVELLLLIGRREI